VVSVKIGLSADWITSLAQSPHFAVADMGCRVKFLG
jgi:hypothetical protein